MGEKGSGCFQQAPMLVCSRLIGRKCLISDTFVNFRFLLRGENGITVTLLPHKFQEFGGGLAPGLFGCRSSDPDSGGVAVLKLRNSISHRSDF